MSYPVNPSPNVVFNDYIRYLRNAWILEQKKLGKPKYLMAMTGDYLADHIDIYDVTDRQYAGINDVIQDLWFNDDPVGNPKAKLRSHWPAMGRTQHVDYWDQLRSYKGLHQRWDRKTWLYVWMVHRITGSGASYVQYHGYKNTIIPELAQFDNISQMEDFIFGYNHGFYTSGGCQIPGFPKLANQHLLPHKYDYSSLPNKAQGKLFLCQVAGQLVDAIETRFQLIEEGLRPRMTHRELMDLCSDFNASLNFNRFNFQYALFAADVSDYLPDLVDPESLVHYGTNSVKALKLMTPKGKGKLMERFDQTAKRIKDTFHQIYDIKLKYKGIENSLCDYEKYLKSQIPKGYNIPSHVQIHRLERDKKILQ